MKPKILTHLGTIPVYYKKGRTKPFRLRVTVGGKRVEKYFTTRAEAEAEWNTLAPLASHPPIPDNGTASSALLNEHESAQYLCLRSLLAGVGLSMAEAVQIAIKQQDAKRIQAAADINQPQTPPPLSFTDQIELIAAAVEMAVEKLSAMEKASVVRPRILRNTVEAARYCGFNDTKAFNLWARRVGFNIPQTKLRRNQRFGFLIEDLDHAILRDPSVCRNLRNAPRPAAPVYDKTKTKRNRSREGLEALP
jgi:hypothetical protein